MKIALPVNSTDFKLAFIEDKFALAETFLIYDSDDESVKYIPNPVEKKNQLSGIGLLIVQALLVEKIDAVVVKLIGRNSINQLIAKKIDIYRVKGKLKARQVIDQFIKGELDKYEKE